MNGCCIVETRPISNLAEIIIDNHIKYIPKNWELTIYCSSINHKYIKDIDFGVNTNIIILEKSKLTKDGYNSMLKSDIFWKSLPYEKVLIFQSDSKLLKNGIEDFLKWDYVGAPFVFQSHGGNGGLSLRDVKLMQKICKKANFTPYNEDVDFCNYMYENNIGKLAPREVCFEFSCEALPVLGTLGVHAIEKWLPKTACEIILNLYKYGNKK